MCVYIYICTVYPEAILFSVAHYTDRDNFLRTSHDSARCCNLNLFRYPFSFIFRSLPVLCFCAPSLPPLNLQGHQLSHKLIITLVKFKMFQLNLGFLNFLFYDIVKISIDSNLVFAINVYYNTLFSLVKRH